MQRNFDTTNGQPFVYFDIQSVRKDPATGVTTVTYQDRWALKSADGVTRFLDETPVTRSFSVHPDDFSKKVDLVDLATGKHLPVQISYGQALAGVIACVRADQEAQDAQ